MKRACLALTVCLSAVPAAPAALAQPPQGDLPKCGQGAKATLAFDGQRDEVVTDAAFGRDKDRESLTLIYKVSGCTLTADEAVPQDPPQIFGQKTGDEIPEGAITLRGEPEFEEASYVVRFNVSSEIDAGSYAGFVQVKAPWLNTVRTPVTVSRSENQIWKPLLLGAAGAVVGFLFFAVARLLKGNDLLVSRTLAIVAGVVSIGAGAVAAFTTNYLGQDVWTWSQNWPETLGAGFSASTSGVMVALLAAVWKADKQE